MLLNSKRHIDRRGALQRQVRQTMQYVVLLTRVDMHLGQSEDVHL